MTYRKSCRILAPALIALPLLAQAEAVLYGEVHVSLDYVDADADAYWHRPAPGGPSFDFQGFVDAANQVLADSGYVGIPGPEQINTAIGDVMFGTIPFDSLAPEVQAGILQALDDNLTPGLPFRGWGLNMSNRGSRLGLRGSEDLGRGLKAIYQVEFEIAAANANANIADGDPDLIRMRNTFAGLEGAWGRFLMGRHDTPLKMSTARLDLFADTLADYNDTPGFTDRRPDNTVLYVSPLLWGIQISGALIPAGGSTPLDVADPRANGIVDGWSVAAVYAAGPFQASMAYERLDRPLWQWQDGLYDLSQGVLASDDTLWRVGLGLLDWHNFDLTAVYESRGKVLGQPDNGGVDLWQVQGAYRMGATRLKAMVGQALSGDCVDPLDLGFRFACPSGVVVDTFGDALGVFAEGGDKSTWALGLDHNFSARSQVYALYVALDDDRPEADWSGFSVGLRQGF
jgi:predicted porin